MDRKCVSPHAHQPTRNCPRHGPTAREGCSNVPHPARLDIYISGCQSAQKGVGGAWDFDFVCTSSGLQCRAGRQQLRLARPII